MRRFNWLIIGSLTLILAMAFLGGCGSAEDEALRANYEALQAELAAIQEVYPPRDFSSLNELEEWLLENDVSDKPITEYAEDWYRRALEVQEDAIADGYIVSVDYDVMEDGESYLVWCTTIINGRVFYWDPETDEAMEDPTFGTVK
jgi:hypothetical protein